MKKISRFSVEYPITVLMIVLGVLLLGLISLQKLGMDIFPDLNNPRLYVELTAGERPPEEIEELYVKNIEALSIQQSNAVSVSSISQTGTTPPPGEPTSTNLQNLQGKTISHGICPKPQHYSLLKP